MNKNHYYEKVHLLIYALISDDHYVYIGKTKSSTLASVHSRHIHGNCAATRDVFGVDPPNRPDLYLLKAGIMTQAIGYKYLLAYIRFFDAHGYTVINHKASLHQAQDLEEDTMALYREISELPLAQQLKEGYIKKPSICLAPAKPDTVVLAPKPKKERAEERICLRLTPCEKQEFLEHTKRLHLSQRDAVLYMLRDQSNQLAGTKGWVIDQAVNYATRKQSQKIQKLEEEVEALKQKISQEERDMSQRMKDRRDVWKQGITTMLSTVMVPSCPVPLTCAKYPKRTEMIEKDGPFCYPAEQKGVELLCPDIILYGKSRPVVRFVLGYNANHQRRKYRFYPSQDFVGVSPPDNRYWIVGSVWLVGWVKAGDGTADLVFAYPLTGCALPQAMLAPQGNTAYEDRPSLQELIKDARC